MTENNIRGTVAATAFVICESRAKRQDISQDIFAQYWVTDETRKLWEILAENVYPYDDISSSLRNRFYLEQLRNFTQTFPNAACINIAAGFSSYPFLLPNDGQFVEIDMINIINYKKFYLQQWQRQYNFPIRNIEFFSADLENADDQRRLQPACKHWCQNKPTFIMMEGLTYYLTKHSFNVLLETIAQSQQSGSKLAFEYWPPNADDYPVYVKLKEYLAKQFGLQHKQYNLFDLNFIEAISGYKLIESSNIAKQELLYSTSRVMQNNANHLPIHFAVLEKK